MTVKQLIKELQKHPQNATVAVTTSNFEQGQSTIELTSVYAFKGEVVQEGFRDAFDGGSYTKKVIRYKGDEKSKDGLTFIKVG